MCAALLASCSSDEPIAVVNQSNKIATNPYRVSLDEALSEANDFFAKIEPVKTRKGTRTVGDVKIITSPKTRSGSTDTLLYVVNYDDNNGFAILGADKRALPVYAISETGHFEVTENSNIELQNILNLYENDANTRVNFGDSISLPPGYNPPDVSLWGDSKEVIIKPMISYFQSRVSAYGEYSKYCKNSKGEPAMSGCVPTAVEIIMSYHRWPKKYKTYTFDWDKINNGDVDQVARLLQFLGTPENLNVRYVNDTTIGTAFYTNVQRTFVNFGYKHPGNYKSFINEEEFAIQSLGNGPLCMQSFSTKYGSGHQWVIDGLMRYYRMIRNNPESIEIQYDVKNLYHCVWGDRDGQCNGYYLLRSGAFRGTPDERDINDSSSNNGAEFHEHDIDIVFLANFQKNF